MLEDKEAKQPPKDARQRSRRLCRGVQDLSKAFLVLVSSCVAFASLSRLKASSGFGFGIFDCDVIDADKTVISHFFPQDSGPRSRPAMDLFRSCYPIGW